MCISSADHNITSFYALSLILHCSPSDDERITMPNTLQQIALVTGGGSRISVAFVKQIHRIGYSILIADLALHPSASAWIESLQPEASQRVVFFQLDVADWAQLEASFNRCVASFGCVPTLVVPGAGVFEPSSNSFWEDQDQDSRYKVFDINLNHPIKTTRIAVRKLVENNLQGTIIHISSIAAQRSSIITPLYTASKHALSSFIREMAPLAEIPGIRVVGVAPGSKKSPFSLPFDSNTFHSVVGSPLYEKREAAKFLDPERDYILPPEAVASAMMTLLRQLDEYEPGTVLLPRDRMAKGVSPRGFRAAGTG
ncbi:uncharacterized protein E0L32_008616 [Thyridium curvatum]|uniref:Uncharacterized protein n=1 Tax=Thyridium curvatum TaxID=1093900 RepID=A0A507ASF0_9PEZI|nr:uncharacterized protein E0L32_008616 [Thyridium curvatum]TPX10397.1 hypothetical protein E0L32_008616 [Thyridium curvatum]